MQTSEKVIFKKAQASDLPVVDAAVIPLVSTFSVSGNQNKKQTTLGERNQSFNSKRRSHARLLPSLGSMIPHR
jgi:hypothetical protein